MEYIFKDMKLHASLFYFSDYPKNRRLCCENTKKVVGKFKGDLNGELAFEFVKLK